MKKKYTAPAKIEGLFYFVCMLFVISCIINSRNIQLINITNNNNNIVTINNNDYYLNSKSTPTTNNTTTTLHHHHHHKNNSNFHDNTSNHYYFSACLLIKDDNHYLIEWLAYHYHVMPLYRLIIAIDPSSQTSPKPILKQWQSRMDITIWEKDSQFAIDLNPLLLQWNAENLITLQKNPKVLWHRSRQRHFYHQCLSTLKKEQQQQPKNNNNNWVMLVDTDEFVHLDESILKQSNNNNNNNVTMLQPGSVLNHLQNIQKQQQQQQQNKTPISCINVPRLQFGPKITTTTHQQQQQQVNTSTIDTTNMTTFRFLHKETKRQPKGKNILQLRHITIPTEPAMSLHQIIPDSCPRPVLSDTKYGIVINHYWGTFEQKMYRNDPRERKALTREYFENDLIKKSTIQDTTILPWLQGFIDSVGIKTAQQLLQGAGELDTKII